MNRLLIFETDIKKDQILIEDEYRMTHLKKIIKVSANDSVKLSFLNQGLGNGVIQELNEKSIYIKFDPKEIKSPSQNSTAKLAVAYSRPPTMKKILEHCTSMGVTEFIFFKATHGEKSYQDSKLWKSDSYKKYLHLGLSQGANLYQLPSVNFCKDATEVLEKISEDQAFYFSPYAKTPLSGEEINFQEPVTFLIGPERGFTETEEKLFWENGLKSTLLHQNVLRVEIATYAALSQLEMLRLSS